MVATDSAIYHDHHPLADPYITLPTWPGSDHAILFFRVGKNPPAKRYGSLEVTFNLFAFEDFDNVTFADVFVILKRHAAFLA